MFKMLKATSLLVVGLLLCSSVHAAGEFKFNNFELGVSSLFQESRYSVSPLIRYAPYYQINEQFQLGVSADIARHKLDDETNFNAVNLLLNLSYQASADWSIAISGGSESRDCDGCDSRSVVGIAAYKKVPYEIIGLKGQSIFIQALSIATDPNTSGAIAGTRFNF